MARREAPHADAYLAAAQDRALDAQALLEAGRWGAACWLSGIALEALLRAYHRRWSDQLDTGHDLHELYRRSGFVNAVEERHIQRVASRIGEVVEIWRHRFRYDPEVRIARSCGHRSADDARFRRCAEVTVEAMLEVASHGVHRWNR